MDTAIEWTLLSVAEAKLPSTDLTETTHLHSLVKAAARALSRQGPHAADSAEGRLELCRRLLANDPDTLQSATWGAEFASLPRDQRHYQISALYMLLMPARRRQRLAAFFTPPHLCDHVFERLQLHGFEVDQHRLLDPASGGAAFLVPAAERLRQRLVKAGLDAALIIERARGLLSGVEIEPGLSRLSELLLADVFSSELAACDQTRLDIIRRANGLKIQGRSQYDVVISNPPYGRVFRASKATMARWAGVISDGHVNSYALFIAASLEQAKIGGLVAVIVPTSFISGPYFERLRDYILANAEVLELNLVEKRSDVFLDVVQDTCVLILRKLGDAIPMLRKAPTVFVVSPAGSTSLGFADLPRSGGRAWGLPSPSGRADNHLFSNALSNLAGYGYRAKAGYFVWNRSRDRLSERTAPQADEVPLVWAHNIKAGKTIELAPRPSRKADQGTISFVSVPPGSSAVITEPAIVLQRTTNRSQLRRLVGGLVPAKVTEQYGGFVSENHTIVVLPQPATKPVVPIGLLLQVLNSPAVDERYRRLSGTVSISTKVLRTLGLPPPAILLRNIGAGQSTDQAVADAYNEALSSGQDDDPAAVR